MPSVLCNIGGLGEFCETRVGFEGEARGSGPQGSHQPVHLLFLANDSAVAKSRKESGLLNVDFVSDVMA